MAIVARRNKKVIFGCLKEHIWKKYLAHQYDQVIFEFNSKIIVDAILGSKLICNVLGVLESL